MRLRTARMPKRLLLGLIPVGIFSAAWHTGGGGLALAAWIVLCACIPGPAYPYPRKSRVHAARLFFTWAGGFFTLSFCLQTSQRFALPPFAFLPGAGALCVLAAAFCYTVSMEKRSRLLLSFLLVFSAGM